MNRIQRAMWRFEVPLAATAYFVTRLVFTGATPMRILGLVVHVVWLAATIYDRLNGGALTRWLYGVEGDPDVRVTPLGVSIGWLVLSAVVGLALGIGHGALDR